MTTSRAEFVEEMFKKSEELVRKFYPWVNDSTVSASKRGELSEQMVDELTALSIAHLSTYVDVIEPRLKPHIIAIVAGIADIELADKDNKNGMVPIQAERAGDITFNPLD